jgi:hypothetical protein
MIKDRRKSMTDQHHSDHSTCPPEILEAYRATAFAIVKAADLAELQRITNPPSRESTLIANPQQQTLAPKIRRAVDPSRGESIDAIIARYISGFRLALEKVDESGHIKLGDLLKYLDRRSISPFKGGDPKKSYTLLARYMQRAKRRLNPLVRPTVANADTEIWTTAAYEAHHKLDDSKD